MQPITLYVTPFVKKFIVKNYGKEPVYVRADSDLGRVFRIAISRDNFLPLEAIEVEEEFLTQKREDGLVKLKFAISFRTGRGKLTHENLKRLSDWLESEFYKAMYYYVKGMRQAHVSERGAVKYFLNDFGIEQEMGLKLEAAVKSVQRNRGMKES